MELVAIRTAVGPQLARVSSLAETVADGGFCLALAGEAGLARLRTALPLDPFHPGEVAGFRERVRDHLVGIGSK